jgi:hypothetical protein
MPSFLSSWPSQDAIVGCSDHLLLPSLQSPFHSPSRYAPHGFRSLIISYPLSRPRPIAVPALCASSTVYACPAMSPCNLSGYNSSSLKPDAQTLMSAPLAHSRSNSRKSSSFESFWSG